MYIESYVYILGQIKLLLRHHLGSNSLQNQSFQEEINFQKDFFQKASESYETHKCVKLNLLDLPTWNILTLTLRDNTM